MAAELYAKAHPLRGPTVRETLASGELRSCRSQPAQREPPEIGVANVQEVCRCEGRQHDSLARRQLLVVQNHDTSGRRTVLACFRSASGSPRSPKHNAAPLDQFEVALGAGLSSGHGNASNGNFP